MNKIELTVNQHNAGIALKAILDRALNGDTFEVIIQDVDHKRSVSANAVVHSWVPIIAEHVGEDVKTTFLRIKRDFGLDIIKQDPEVAKRLDFMFDKIGYHRMTDRQQLNVVDLLNVTSIMNHKQHSQLRDAVQNFWESEGVRLTYDNTSR